MGALGDKGCGGDGGVIVWVDSGVSAVEGIVFPVLNAVFAEPTGQDGGVIGDCLRRRGRGVGVERPYDLARGKVDVGDAINGCGRDFGDEAHFSAVEFALIAEGGRYEDVNNVFGGDFGYAGRRTRG